MLRWHQHRTWGNDDGCRTGKFAAFGRRAAVRPPGLATGTLDAARSRPAADHGDQRGGLTPEVFDLLRELMVENDTRETDGPDSAAGACPHLTHCETRQGLCPVLVGCGTYTALADVEVQAKD